MQRRQFMTASAIGMAGVVSAFPSRLMGGPQETKDVQATAIPDSKAWLWKTLKIGMVKEGKSLREKFEIAKASGFSGIELNAPGFDTDEANDAAEQTGLIIDGTVGGYHWKTRHTDPDPNVRQKALDLLRQGIEATAAVGADTMLLVPGRGDDGSTIEVRQRASTAINAALPHAERHGVKILIENVWNQMFYSPEGGDQQTADDLAAFVDSFKSPWVGVQFDIGNHWKFGDPAGWIRTLADRIVKLDIKGYSREQQEFTAITQGDIDWPSVKQALRDVDYRGWLAAEVSGGDGAALRKVSEQMESALDCRESVT